MQAIILAGGLGTRLRELYPDIPKALVPILGKPFLAWQIEWLRHGGATGIHIAAGHKASAVKDWLKTDPAGAGVTLSEEPQPLGTAGGRKLVVGRGMTTETWTSSDLAVTFYSYDDLCHETGRTCEDVFDVPDTVAT